MRKVITRNQTVVISGILVLLATATIAATSYNVGTAKAISSGGNNFGHNTASIQAQDGVGNSNNPANGNGLGATTSGLAQAGGFGSGVSKCATGAISDHCASTNP